MKYVMDGRHSKAEEGLISGFEEALKNMKNAEVFLEDINTSQEQKRIKERVYEDLLGGDVVFQGNKMSNGEWTLDQRFGEGKKARSEIELFKVIGLNRENVEKVHNGPVYNDYILEIVEGMEGLSDSEEIDMWAEFMGKRDRKYKEYIDSEVEDPENSVVVMGAAHALYERLREDYEVEVVNDIIIKDPVMRTAKSKSILEY